MSIRLKPIVYKDYTWPHNPTFYQIRFIKDIIEHRYPKIHGAELEDFGMNARVFSGSGVFFGEDAYVEFGKLATVFYDLGPGKLIHPLWMPTDAVFSRLEVKQEPTPNYVEYEFEFIEYKKINIITEIIEPPQPPQAEQPEQPVPEQQSTPKKAEKEVTHTVKQGETLSHIGVMYGVPWRTIADYNKSTISNPNIIRIGQKIVIPNPKKSPALSSSQRQSSQSTNNIAIPKRTAPQSSLDRLFGDGPLSGIGRGN